MKKLSLILFIMSLSTTSVAESCHTEPGEVKHESASINTQNKKLVSIERQQQDWQEHQNYLNRLDKGVQK